MEHVFTDISKYYAANIVDQVLTVGRIIYRDGMYQFARDNMQGPFNLVNPEDDPTLLVRVIGEIHPLSAIDGLIDASDPELQSCLYLNENEENGEIEVRSIHKGMGTAIFSRQQCPLILWNPSIESHRYFDVMDIESLRAFELFPPLLNVKK